MNYTAKKPGYRHFELYDDRDVLIGKLDYPSWYSMHKAELTAGNRIYNLRATGFFMSTIEITEGEIVVATLKYNWRTAFEITMSNGTVYRFKRMRIFGGNFGLYNSNDHLLIELATEFHLSKFSYSYTFRTDDNYAEANSPLLLLLMLYTLNFVRARSAAAASA